MSTIAIAYKYLPDYRVGFFEELRRQLTAVGQELVLFHGDPHGVDGSKKDERHLEWSCHVRNRRVAVGGRDLTYQPVFRATRKVDLVIVEQANKLLVNYALLARRKAGGRASVAFWGHGRNMQAESPGTCAERFKRTMLNLPDWWFTYTPGTRRYLEANGVPCGRISCLNNSTDVEALRGSVEAVSAAEVAEFERTHELTPGRTAIYVGGLYRDKRIDELLHVADLVFQHDERFRLVVCGAGDDEGRVKEAANRGSVVFLGPVFGQDRAIVYAAASLSLMTGTVGLSVVDAFAAGLPVIACDLPRHGPEFEYLEHGVSGLVVRPDVRATAAALLDVLENPERLARLAVGARTAGSSLGVTQMAANMVEGVQRCLAR